MAATLDSEPRVFKGDLPGWMVRDLRAIGMVACDIETTGLDPHADQIGSCQIHNPALGTALVRPVKGRAPQGLRSLLEDDRVEKVFHHAVFDLRFIQAQWQAAPRNIRCTKVAAKIVLRGEPNDALSLKPLLQRFLHVSIDKGPQLSDWAARSLTDSQIRYAAADVEHLIPLLAALIAVADPERRELIDRCFVHLPTRVTLELEGYGDVFAY